MELRSYIIRASYFIGVIFSLALVGCGGGGSSSASNPPPVTPPTSNTAPTSPTTFNGSTSRATVTVDNSIEISDGTYQAARKAESYTVAPTSPGLFRSISEPAKISDIVSAAKQSMIDALALRSSAVQARFDETIACEDGGTSRIIFPDLDPADLQSTTIPESGRGSVINNNCREGGTIVDGVIDISWTNSFVDFELTYDITVTDILTGQSQTVTGSASCLNNGSDCTYGEDFASSNGIDYRVEDVTVTGDTSGYNMTARVYNETYGYVDFVATGITYCPGGTGNLATGNILATDSTGNTVLEVEITSCDECVVIFGGVSTIVDQP